MDIIMYLIQLIQCQHKQICWLLNFIYRYIPLKQWAFDDSRSPKYEKFKIDRLPIIQPFIKQDWQFLLEYYKWKYGKPIKPVQRRNAKSIPEDISCPLCGAPHHYIYDNNGGNGQYPCKICGQTFVNGEQVTSPVRLKCPHCTHTLVPKKDRKHFIVHKCVNPKCPYYLHNLKKVDKKDLDEDYGKNKYKLHYIYRQFTIDFFKMDLNSLPNNASSLKFSKFDSHTMSHYLTLHVNLGLSLRKTKQALKDLYNIDISHQTIANYCKTAAICVKPFVDNFDYGSKNVFTADETYIKIRGIKAYIWFIMDAASRSIIGYQVSDNRGVGPCILAMRILKNRMVDCSLLDASGVHLEPTGRAKMCRWRGFKCDGFDLVLNLNISNNDISIFKIQKICDTIHLSSFQMRFPQKYHTEKRKKGIDSFQKKKQD